MTSLKTVSASTGAQTTHTKYRPDIDGLRAIAVGAVVIFHAFPSLLKGGFIGVDIFFIISGFLISQILFSSLDKQKFSLLDFYSRRINRIYPALITVLASCLIFGWLALLPDEYKQLGKHTAGGAGFVANLLLWRESGYFDVLSESKPLLHLWSLGVEEQFYIVWPLFLALLWKSKLNKPITISIFIAASFYLNVSLSSSNPTAAFYSPLTRFWELLLGAMLAYKTTYARSAPLTTPALTNGKSSSHSPNLSNFIENLQAFVGLALIGVGFALITKQNMFPGYWALLPSLGTVLIIHAGPDAWFNKNILSHRFMVFVGLISFPLYLWHWPLLSFLRVIEGELPSPVSRSIAVTASVVLAWATYRLIEIPLRYKTTGKAKTITLFFLMGVLGLIGLAIYKADGLPKRAALATLEQKSNDLNFYQLSQCKDEKLLSQSMSWCNKSTPSSTENIILWGDSHAEHLFPGIKSLSQENWLLIGRHSCPPILGEKAWLTSASKEDCELANNAAINLIAKSDAKVVVLAWLGNLYTSDKGLAPEHILINDENPQNRYIIGEINDPSHKQELFNAAMTRTVQTLLDLGKQVVIVKDTPEFMFDPRACLSRPFRPEARDCSVPKQQFITRNAAYSMLLDRLAGMSPNVKIFDAASVFCDAQRCTQSDPQHEYFRDGHHLSNEGSLKVARQLIELTH